jgi:hypothetical protein
MTLSDAVGKGRHRADPGILAALSAGATVDEAAQEAAVSPRTVDRRLADPAFRAELAEIQSRALERTASALANTSIKAVNCLASLIDDLEAPPTVRLGAAAKLLDHALRYNSSNDPSPQPEPVTREQRIAAIFERWRHLNGLATATPAEPVA